MSGLKNAHTGSEASVKSLHWVFFRLTTPSLAFSLWEAPTSMLLVLSPLCWKFSHHSVKGNHLPLP